MTIDQTVRLVEWALELHCAWNIFENGARASETDQVLLCHCEAGQLLDDGDDVALFVAASPAAAAVSFQCCRGERGGSMECALALSTTISTRN